MDRSRPRSTSLPSKLRLTPRATTASPASEESIDDSELMEAIVRTP